MNAHRMVLEIDDSAIQSDQRLLYQAVRSFGVEHTLRYDHLRSREEPLLAIPDAAAWCWARCGRWWTRVQQVVTDVRPA